jgi:hypothetical protein
MTVGFGGDVVAWPPGQEKIGFLLALLVRPGHQMILGHVTKIGGEAVCAKEATASACALDSPLIGLYPSEELVKGVQPVVSP